MDGIVPLSVDFTAAAGTQTTATVERGLSATGPWTLIGSIELLNQIGITSDTTAPFDTPVWYRFVGSPGDAEIIQGPFTEVSDGTVWLKDPLRPWANLNLTFCSTPQQAFAAACVPDGPDLIWAGYDDRFTRRADAHLFDIFNAEHPADHYGRRKFLDGGLRILSKTLAARDAVHTLFTAGGPIQIQLPAVYGLSDVIVQPMDLVEAYISQDQRRPYRLWTAPFTVVELPFGPIQGTTCANWCAVRDTYATFADLTAAAFTWQEVAEGDAGGAGC